LGELKVIEASTVTPETALIERIDLAPLNRSRR
jgi:hypothetical protein